MKKIVGIEAKRAAIRAFIGSIGGQMFSVGFVKKTTGEYREMNARMGVTKYLKGGENTCAGHADILTTFDVVKGQYRNITLDNVRVLKGAGMEIHF